MLRFDKTGFRQGGFSLSADFRVEAGSMTAIIGPSGAGKSTLLAGLAGFLPPDSGRILWDATDITTLPPARRPVAMLFQDNNLFPHLTIEQNIGLGVRPDLGLTAQDLSRVDEVLAQTGLKGLGARKPAELSGGQMGRAALARVLLQRRPILALDEPFAALGPGLRAEMLDLVRGIALENGTTVLMVTHDPADALALGGEASFVHDGQVTFPQSAKDLLAAPQGALRDYLGTNWRS